MTDAQRKLCLSLQSGDGIVDRYGRVVVAGIAVTKYGSTTPLNCFYNEWIEAKGKRIRLTELGRRALDADIA